LWSSWGVNVYSDSAKVRLREFMEHEIVGHRGRGAAGSKLTRNGTSNALVAGQITKQGVLLMLEIIKKHLADLSASEWNDFQSSLAGDAIYEEMATLQRVKGAEHYVRAVQQWKRAFPDLRATFLNGFIGNDKVVVEILWEGTHTGPFDGPFGAIAPTGKRSRVNAALIYTLNAGKIVESRHYFDLLTLLGQIGMVPTMEASAPAPVNPATVPRW
jgi:steroid delta-isomerase-like uncharacterized protein